MATSFGKVHTANRELNQVQENVARALAPIFGNPIVDGVLLTGVVLASGANVISHTLDRKLVGWIIIRQRALAQVYDTQDSNATPALTLQLQASAPVTVDLYVF
jgi:hypothetical protein